MNMSMVMLFIDYLFFNKIECFLCINEILEMKPETGFELTVASD